MSVPLGLMLVGFLCMVVDPSSHYIHAVLGAQKDNTPRSVEVSTGRITPSSHRHLATSCVAMLVFFANLASLASLEDQERVLLLHGSRAQSCYTPCM